MDDVKAKPELAIFFECLKAIQDCIDSLRYTIMIGFK